MTLKTLVLFAVLSAPAAALAEPALGTWLSPPDGKGQVGHVEVRNCGQTLCGTLVRAYDKSGQQVVTPNVGKRLFWDMEPRGGGAYDDGQVYVPVFGRNYDAEMTVAGDRLVVKGCLGPVCKNQTWTRVR